MIDQSRKETISNDVAQIFVRKPNGCSYGVNADVKSHISRAARRHLWAVDFLLARVGHGSLRFSLHLLYG